MNDLTIAEPFCDSQFEDNCGYHPAVASLYMISFVLLTTLTMLKLLIAVILDNFSDAVEMDMEKEVLSGCKLQ